MEISSITPKVARKMIKQGLSKTGQASLTTLSCLLKQLANDEHMDNKAVEMVSDLEAHEVFLFDREVPLML